MQPAGLAAEGRKCRTCTALKSGAPSGTERQPGCRLALPPLRRHPLFSAPGASNVEGNGVQAGDATSLRAPGCWSRCAVPGCCAPLALAILALSLHPARSQFYHPPHPPRTAQELVGTRAGLDIPSPAMALLVQCRGVTQQGYQCRYHGVANCGNMFCGHHIRQAGGGGHPTRCRACGAGPYFFPRPGVTFFCQQHKHVGLGATGEARGMWARRGAAALRAGPARGSGSGGARAACAGSGSIRSA